MTKRPTLPWIYLITDRKACKNQDLLALIEQAGEAGVDLIQIREKDLSARALADLVQGARQRLASSPTRLLVNDRMDVALTCGADGVHLTTQSLPTAVVRKLVGRDFLIGVSTHSLEEATRAENEGADFIVLGPVFPTPSKRGFGPPLGLAAFEEIARRITIPVLAIGGITLDTAPDVLARGASGIAAIRLFAQADSVAGVVAALKSLRLSLRE